MFFRTLPETSDDPIANEHSALLRIATFNCKNVYNSQACIKNILDFSDFICIQEHWLFKFEQENIGDLFSKTSWTCKSVDENNPIPPTQRPRGYGGVAILWKQSMDHLVEQIEDGSERIICIKLKVKPKPILLICAYMPCNGSKQANTHFKECLDQLHEIITKYSDTCTPVLCGDWNCDLMKSSKKPARSIWMEEFINSKKLAFKPTPLTFIHPNGNESSTIDYIFVHSNLADKVNNTIRLDMLPNNTSDHYPLLTEIEIEMDSGKEKDKNFTSNKIKWDKIDLLQYQECLTKSLQENIIDFENDPTAITKLMDTIIATQESIVPTSKKSSQRSKHIWNDEIENSLKTNKKALYEWKMEGKPQIGETMQVRKRTKKQLRKARRQEIARQRDESLQTIMNAKQRDSKIFHKLVNAQRKSKRNGISDLCVEDKTYSTREEILQGWNEHFSKLATPETTDLKSDTNKKFDIDIIEEICKENAEPLVFTSEEVDKAINQLNTNKAPDIYGITAEHIRYGGDALLQGVTAIINNICKEASVPDCLKHGILTPIFKNKGLSTDAKNYRGITVLPIIGKILEILLRQLIRDIIDILQNRLQRGFTPGVSPLYSALILLESIAESMDQKLPIFVALLDAKAAFDVVNHDSLHRKLFLSGVGGTLWLLIRQLSTYAITSIKWNGLISNPFPVHQGVRQGGILSTELYKVYINDILDQLENSGLGSYIGNIYCGSPTCADDVALVANSPSDLQSMISTVENYSIQEKYKLQPTKSLVLKNVPSTRNTDFEFEINNTAMLQPSSAPHIGIKHSSDLKKTINIHIEGNISKARRTMYSLMGAGLHGKNGLNPITCLHIFQIYILPVLIYGLDILLPDKKHIEPLEVFYRKAMKQILSLPNNTADAAVYTMTGVIPIQGTIHKAVINIYNKICGMESSIEKELAERQLLMSGFNSQSWFSKARCILAQYNLPSAHDLMLNPINTNRWKTQVKKAVDSVWHDQLRTKVSLYSSLNYLSTNNILWRNTHPCLASVGTSSQDISRLQTKLKLLTGTYYLQSNKASFNQNSVDPTCLLCKESAETVDHFLLECKTLHDIRIPYLHELESFLCSFRNCTKCFNLTNVVIDAQLILDPSHLLCACGCRCKCTDNCFMVEYISRKLCYALHAKRNELLKTLPSSKSKSQRL